MDKININLVLTCAGYLAAFLVLIIAGYLNVLSPLIVQSLFVLLIGNFTGLLTPGPLKSEQAK